MPVEIEGQQFSLFKDYDRLKLPALSLRGKVRWFDLRTRLVLVRPLERIRPGRRETRGHPRASFMLVFGAVLFNGVEALGSFYRGKRGTHETFKDFVHDFMDPRLRPHVDKLRDHFRNGLAHGLTIKDGGFEFGVAGPLRVDPVLGLEIDPNFLLSDFKRARRSYLQRVRTGGPASAIGQAFSKRFHDIFER